MQTTNSLPSNPITADEFHAWVKNPVTQVFMERIQLIREDHKEAVVTGLGIEHSIGICQGLNYVLNVTAEDLGAQA